jgi:hypothetical protein
MVSDDTTLSGVAQRKKPSRAVSRTPDKDLPKYHREHGVDRGEQNQNQVPEHAERMAQTELGVDPRPRSQTPSRFLGLLPRRISSGTLRQAQRQTRSGVHLYDFRLIPAVLLE